MSIKLKTHKILWAKSGNRCAHNNCKNVLNVDETLTDDDYVNFTRAVEAETVILS